MVDCRHLSQLISYEKSSGLICANSRITGVVDKRMKKEQKESNLVGPELLVRLLNQQEKRSSPIERVRTSISRPSHLDLIAKAERKRMVMNRLTGFRLLHDITDTAEEAGRKAKAD